MREIDAGAAWQAGFSSLSLDSALAAAQAGLGVAGSKTANGRDHHPA